MNGFSNLDTFNAALDKFGGETLPNAGVAFQKAMAFRVLGCSVQEDDGSISRSSGLLDLTPVDTGRARGNYQVSVGEGVDSVREDNDFKGETGEPASSTEQEQALAGMAEVKLGQSIFITNNVPYIEYLNDGTDKAPAHHMLERAIDNALQSVQR